MSYSRRQNRKLTNPHFKRIEKYINVGAIISVLALFALACWMRWHALDVPFDRDSYDEGVYWQSLRSLAQGHILFREIFSSQPPAFLLSIFPAYLIFGQSILAARVGIALFSLGGVFGALFAGRALRGNRGAILALLLLIVSPLYLKASQTLQAEGPSTALMLLAVGLAYLWSEHPAGLTGYALAMLSANILAWSILSKLFGLAGLVPIGLLVLAHLWRSWQQPVGKRIAYSGSVIAGASGFVITCLLFIVPFSDSLTQLWDQVVTFHTAANHYSALSMKDNIRTLTEALLAPLGGLALCGVLVSLARRDWRVLPLIGWFFATLCLLWRQAPLFNRHLVTLVPPLLLLATMGLGSLSFKGERFRVWTHLGEIVILFGICATVVHYTFQIQDNYRSVQRTALGNDVRTNFLVARDLDAITQPDQLVITDAQFLVAEADRNTPPQLVDTSFVRIQTNYLRTAQLVEISKQSNVHTILFYTWRLYGMRDFYLWVSQHFKKAKDYGDGRELWIKVD